MTPVSYSSIRSYLIVITLAFTIPLLSSNVNAATLSTDLQTLVTQGNEINSNLALISLTTENSCDTLTNNIALIETFTADIETLSNSLVAPISIDTESLTALDDLAVIAANIAGTLPLLSDDINAIATANELADIQAALDAMLVLSDDIGTMADRILEMADKILIMADNIGLMADRIILTQQIQSTNLALTQAAILSTQKNIITLLATVDTSAYNPGLIALVDTGNILSVDLGNSQLTTVNMSAELTDFSARVTTYLTNVSLLYTQLGLSNTIASNNINAETLTLLGDLSVINSALASAINNFAQAINTLAPDTDIAVLNSAVYSMLRLSSDIGIMGGRIVEMGDQIIVMADNIGLMVDKINTTQTLQQSNLELTQNNLRTAQIATISVIQTFGL